MKNFEHLFPSAMNLKYSNLIISLNRKARRRNHPRRRRLWWRPEKEDEVEGQ